MVCQNGATFWVYHLRDRGGESENRERLREGGGLASRLKSKSRLSIDKGRTLVDPYNSRSVGKRSNCRSSRRGLFGW